MERINLNTPKVSVIVPVYNTQAYLNQCIESLRNQTLKDIEIICTDDGSTDDSLSILQEFAAKDERIKIIRQKNAGQSAARNRGIVEARGEYIGFLDADDYVLENAFEKMYENAKKFDSDISMCSIRVNNEKTNTITDNDSYLSLQLFSRDFDNRAFKPEEAYDFLFRICVTPWNKIYKRELFTNIKFPEGLNFEDNVFFIDIFTDAKSVSLIREPLVVYRKNSSTSYSHSSQDYKKEDFFRIYDLIEEILRKKNIFNTHKGLKENFECSKKNTLIYWYNKLTDKNTESSYRKKLDSLYPDLCSKTLTDWFNKG